LVSEMIAFDREEAEKEALLVQKGFDISASRE